MSRRTGTGLAYLSSRPGHAGGERFHRAGKFQRRTFYQRWRDFQLLQEGWQVLRPHRRPRRQAARFRAAVHIRCLSAAAVSGSVSQWPAAEFRGGLGFAQQGATAASAGSTFIPIRRSRPPILCTGRDATRRGITCAPIATPPTCARITISQRTATHTKWSEIDVVLRILSRTRLESCGMGANSQERIVQARRRPQRPDCGPEAGQRIVGSFGTRHGNHALEGADPLAQ